MANDALQANQLPCGTRTNGPVRGKLGWGLEHNTKTFRKPALDLLGGSRATHGVPDEEPRVMGRLIDCAVLP